MHLSRYEVHARPISSISLPLRSSYPLIPTLVASPSLVLCPRTDWVPDVAVEVCQACRKKFNLLIRNKHHCRVCGRVFCDSCSNFRLTLEQPPPATPQHPLPSNHVRACSACFRKHGVKHKRRRERKQGEGSQQTTHAQNTTTLTIRPRSLSQQDARPTNTQTSDMQPSHIHHSLEPSIKPSYPPTSMLTSMSSISWWLNNASYVFLFCLTLFFFSPYNMLHFLSFVLLCALSFILARTCQIYVIPRWQHEQHTIKQPSLHEQHTIAASPSLPPGRPPASLVRSLTPTPSSTSLCSMSPSPPAPLLNPLDQEMVRRANLGLEALWNYTEPSSVSRIEWQLMKRTPSAPQLDYDSSMEVHSCWTKDPITTQKIRVWKAEGFIPATPAELFALFYDWQHQTSWNKSLMEYRLIHQVPHDRTHLTYGVSTPQVGGLIDSREFLDLHTYGRRMEACPHTDGQQSPTTYQHVHYAFGGVGIDDDKLYKHPRNRKYVRALNGPSGYIFKTGHAYPSSPSSQLGTTFILVMNPHLRGWLPQSAIDANLPAVMTEFIQNLRKVVQDKVNKKETLPPLPADMMD